MRLASTNSALHGSSEDISQLIDISSNSSTKSSSNRSGGRHGRGGGRIPKPKPSPYLYNYNNDITITHENTEVFNENNIIIKENDDLNKNSNNRIDENIGCNQNPYSTSSISNTKSSNSMNPYSLSYYREKKPDPIIFYPNLTSNLKLKPHNISQFLSNSLPTYCETLLCISYGKNHHDKYHRSQCICDINNNIKSNTNHRTCYRHQIHKQFEKSLLETKKNYKLLKNSSLSIKSINNDNNINDNENKKNNIDITKNISISSKLLTDKEINYFENIQSVFLLLAICEEMFVSLSFNINNGVNLNSDYLNNLVVDDLSELYRQVLNDINILSALVRKEIILEQNLLKARNKDNLTRSLCSEIKLAAEKIKLDRNSKLLKRQLISSTLTNSFLSSSIADKNVVKRSSPARNKRNKPLVKVNYKDKIKDIGAPPISDSKLEGRWKDDNVNINIDDITIDINTNNNAIKDNDVNITNHQIIAASLFGELEIPTNTTTSNDSDNNYTLDDSPNNLNNSGINNENSNFNSKFNSNNNPVNGESNISSAYVSFDILQELSLLIGIRIVLVNSLKEIKKISIEENEETISINTSHNILIINLEKVIKASKEVIADLYSNDNKENGDNSLKDLITIATLESESILSFLNCRELFLFQNNINNTISNLNNSSRNKMKNEGTYKFWKNIESLRFCLSTSQFNHLARHNTIVYNTIIDIGDNNDFDNIIHHTKTIDMKSNINKNFAGETIHDVELINWLYRAHQSIQRSFLNSKFPNLISSVSFPTKIQLENIGIETSSLLQLNKSNNVDNKFFSYAFNQIY